MIALGLWRIPEKMIKAFHYFGKGVVILITAATAAIVFETLTGLVIIPGMTPLSEGLMTIGSIAIILMGAFPLVFVITKYLNKPLKKVGEKIGIGATATAGIIASLANNIPMFAMFKDMDDRGKIINVAFAVSAAFILGDHLGFTAGVAPNMIFPVIVGKFTGGVTAVLLALWIIKDKKKSN